MSGKHTPGPWAKSALGREVRAADHSAICRMATTRCNDESNANALLIATAPELLAVLQELIDIEGPQPGTAAWADKARAIIAKATGSAS